MNMKWFKLKILKWLWGDKLTDLNNTIIKMNECLDKAYDLLEMQKKELELLKAGYKSDADYLRELIKRAKQKL